MYICIDIYIGLTRVAAQTSSPDVHAARAPLPVLIDFRIHRIRLTSITCPVCPLLRRWLRCTDF